MSWLCDTTLTGLLVFTIKSSTIFLHPGFQRLLTSDSKLWHSPTQWSTQQPHPTRTLKSLSCAAHTASVGPDHKRSQQNRTFPCCTGCIIVQSEVRVNTGFEFEVYAEILTLWNRRRKCITALSSFLLAHHIQHVVPIRHISVQMRQIIFNENSWNSIFLLSLFPFSILFFFFREEVFTQVCCSRFPSAQISHDLLLMCEHEHKAKPFTQTINIYVQPSVKHAAEINFHHTHCLIRWFLGRLKGREWRDEPTGRKGLSRGLIDFCSG